MLFMLMQDRLGLGGTYVGRVFFAVLMGVLTYAIGLLWQRAQRKRADRKRHSTVTRRSTG